MRYIPKSLRAAAALIIMLVSTSYAFDAIGKALIHPSVGRWLLGSVELIIGLVATVCFYRFQTIDSHPAKTIAEIEVEALAHAGMAANTAKPEGSIVAYNLDDAPQKSDDTK